MIRERGGHELGKGQRERGEGKADSLLNAGAAGLTGGWLGAYSQDPEITTLAEVSCFTEPPRWPQALLLCRGNCSLVQQNQASKHSAAHSLSPKETNEWFSWVFQLFRAKPGAPRLLLVGVLLCVVRKVLMGAGCGRSWGGLIRAGETTAQGLEEQCGHAIFGCSWLWEAKLEMMEFVNFLENPKQYQDLGANIPEELISENVLVFWVPSESRSSVWFGAHRCGTASLLVESVHFISHRK